MLFITITPLRSCKFITDIFNLHLGYYRQTKKTLLSSYGLQPYQGPQPGQQYLILNPNYMTEIGSWSPKDYSCEIISQYISCDPVVTLQGF